MDPYFKLLINLYPLKFRKQYGREMLEVFSLQESPTDSKARHMLGVLKTTLRTMPWILKENLHAFLLDYARTPRAIKLQYILSTVLVLPFFVIVSHNLLQLLLWHQVSDIFAFIGAAWPVYGIIMPCLAILISLLGIMWYVSRVGRNDAVEAYESGRAPHGSLILPVIFIVMALIAVA